MKVKLRVNLRYFEADDSDFSISAGQTKDLHKKDLKSYSIKFHLFNGGLKLVEGAQVIIIKHAKILFSAELNPFCFGIEFGKFFKKNIETQELFWIDKDEITNQDPEIYNALMGEELEEEEVKEPEEQTGPALEPEPLAELDPEEEVSEEEDSEEEASEEEEASKEDEKVKEPYTKDNLMALVKPEQIKILESLGLSSQEIKALKYEADRVAKILELQK